MSVLRCVVVEDEAESRANMAAYLAGADGVELAGVAADGAEAVRLLDACRPDLVLLDVRLPEMDGLEVLRHVSHRPEVVFTTAYEDYAIAAFELGALDYLVKPFGRARLLAAVERVRARTAGPGGAAGAPGSVDRALDASARPLTRLFARKGDRIVPVPVAEILHVRASGEYAEIHTAREELLVHVPLKELVLCLDPRVFVQVHRAHIVNLDAVLHFRAADDRRLLVTLKDGTGIVASRSASERLRALVR